MSTEKIAKTRSRVAKAKHGLLLPASVKLPRCPGKKMRYASPKQTEHNSLDHLCDECRCRKTAGEGTSHLGVGYCFEHEQDRRYKYKAERVVEAQTQAVRQGYPEKGYEYEVLDSDRALARIRKDATEAKANRHFHEEWNLAKLQLQRLIDSWDEGSETTFTVRSKTTGELVEADDLEKANLLIKLVGAIGKIGRDQLVISERDTVSLDNVKEWAGDVVGLISKYVIEEEKRVSFIKEFAELLSNVRGK